MTDARGVAQLRPRPGVLLLCWIVWAVVTACLVFYVEAAHIESAPHRTRLTLTPGAEAELVVHRWFDNSLRLTMVFSRQPGEKRPELGEVHGSRTASGCTTYPVPGAGVRLEISDGLGAPWKAETMPANGFGATSIDRGLTTNPSIAPGVYCTPLSPVSRLMARRGTNRFLLKVTHVDAPLAGETVEVAVPGALGIKSAYENVLWLLPALFLEPVFWVIQAIWFGWLLVLSLRYARRNARPPVT